MKQSFITMPLLLVLVASGLSQTQPGVITEDITSEWPVVPDGETRWFSVFRMDSVYAVDLYAVHEGKRHKFGFGYTSSEDFDRVSYSWIKENHVAFRLHHSVTGKELKFKISSDNPDSAAMAVDD